MAKGKIARIHSKRQPTFQEQVAAMRLANAARAFMRGKLASELRHCAAASSLRRSSRTLGRLKQEAVRAAIAIAPDVVQVGLDDEIHVGLLSVVFPGEGRLHLPPTALDPVS